MVIDGKNATSIRLWCPNHELGCPGYIGKEVLVYLLETDELYIYGKCEECDTSGNVTVSLMKLLSQCPVTAIM
jgi:hypothetical protein